LRALGNRGAIAGPLGRIYAPDMKREILIWPDPRLKQKSKAVKEFGPEFQQLVDDLFETMYAAEGVGLASAQIGVHKRVLVIDTSPRQEGQTPLVLVNPEIVAAEGKAEYTEGCLSVPGEYEDVGIRAEKVSCKALDRNGQPFTIAADGLLAIAIQHEMDHLEGVLFVDYLSSLKRGMIKKRMERLKLDRAAEPEAAEPPSASKEPEPRKGYRPRPQA
jgi:peptide deformylase